MTQEEHLDGGDRAGKSVSDRNNDGTSSSSRKTSDKNSSKKSPKFPTKMQRIDRKTDQSNKSVIRKTSSSSKEVGPIASRDRKNRNKVGASNKPIVGNQNERVGATADPIGDKDSATEMTVISQQNNGGLRESIPSDAIDNAKISPAVETAAVKRTQADVGVGSRISEATPTAINTDLQGIGAAGGIDPTNENNTSADEKKDSDEGHSEVSRGTHADKSCDDSEKEPKESSAVVKEGSCLQPIPKTDDPIARLNALRANISNALKEVKAVLDQHGPPPETTPAPAQNKDIGGTDEACVQFRFVKRTPKKNVIKFEDEEIICNVPPDSSAANITQDLQMPADLHVPMRMDTIDKTENQFPTDPKNESIEPVRSGDTETTELSMKTQDYSEEKEASPNVNDNKSKIKKTIRSLDGTQILETVEKVSSNYLKENLGSSEESSNAEKVFQVKVIEGANAATANEQPINTIENVQETVSIEETISKPELKTKNKTIETPDEQSPKVPKKQLTNQQKGETKSSSNESVNHDDSIKKSLKLGTKIPQLKNANQRLVGTSTNDLRNNMTSVDSGEKKATKLSKQPSIQSPHLVVEAKPSKDGAILEVDNKQSKTFETLSNQSQNLSAEPAEKSDTLTVNKYSPIASKPAEYVDLPTKLPKKKPEDKCVNVEPTAMEILNRKRKNDVGEMMATEKPGQNKISTENSLPSTQTMVNQNDTGVPEDKPHSVETKIPKITTKTMKSSNVIQETEMPSISEGISARKVALNDTSDASHQGGMLSKPPLNLRVKRASFTEPSKEPPKSKIAKPKRASIGSESDVVILAREHLLPKKDATEQPLNDKSPKIKESLKDDKLGAVPGGDGALLDKKFGDTSTKPSKELSSVESATPSTSRTALKSSLSGVCKIEPLAEIAPTPLKSASATITQPIPIQSNDGAKIASELSQHTPEVGSPLISSSDKLVSSKSAGLSDLNSVAGSPPKMTVVKKDKVPSIAPKQSLEELNDKVKQSETIKDSLDCNLNVLSKLSVESINQVESLLKANEDKTPVRVKQNGEVLAHNTEKSLRLKKAEKVRKTKHVEVPSVHIDESDNQVPPVSSRIDDSSTLKGPILGANDPVLGKDKVINISNEDLQLVDGSISSSKTTDSQPTLESEAPKKQDDEVSAGTPLPLPSDTESPVAETKPAEAATTNEHLTSTATESSLSEAEKDGASVPKAKKTRKTKKVVIRRVKRKLSRDGSLEEKTEPEVCDKPIADPLTPTEEIIEEPIVEEPPVPKAPKSCLVKRSYEPGQMVLYADRIRKSVKWKHAKVIEKITDNSYKLEFDGSEKPAHISYIKKFTDKKVQFGGKEYLEIDYQQEYESSEEEEVYNIWARV